MTGSSDIRLSVIEEETPGTTPATPRLQVWQHSGENLVYKPAFEEDQSIPFDAMPLDPIHVGWENGGTVKFNLSFPDEKSPFNIALKSAMRAQWDRTSHRETTDNDQVVIAAASTVPWGLITNQNYFPRVIEGRPFDGIVLAAGDLVLLKNQTNKAENGIYRAAAKPAMVAVKCATTPTTGNVTHTSLKPGVMIDNHTLALNDIVLVKNQTSTSQNGIYTITANGAVRNTEFDDNASQFHGKIYWVESGNKNKYTVWQYTGAASGALGSTAITFDVKNYSDTRDADYNTWSELQNAPLIRVSGGTANGGMLFKINAAEGGTLGTTEITVSEDTTSSAIYSIGVATVSVDVIATSNVATANGLENGDTVDGVTLKTGDLVLLTAQTTASQNGIYTVPASGAATRPAAYDSWNELVGVWFKASSGGNAGKLYKTTATTGGGTLGTDNIAFTERTSVPIAIGGSGGSFAVGHLVKFRKLGANTLARCLVAGTTDPEFAAESISYVAAPDNYGSLRVVGFEGVAGDLAVHANGTMTSALLDFTTLDLQREMWVKISGYTARPNRNAWVQISKIEVHRLTFDNLPENWGVGSDAGTGVAVRVFFGDILNFGKDSVAATISRTAIRHTPPTHIVQRGMHVNVLDLTVAARKPAQGSVTFKGMSGSTTPPAGASYNNPVSTITQPPFAGGPSVGSLRIADDGTPGPNWVKGFTVKIDAGATDIEDVSQEDLAGVKQHDPAVTLTAETYFGDATLLSKMLAREKVTLHSRLQAANQALVMMFHRLTATDGNPNADAKRKDVMLPLQFTASRRDDGRVVTFNRIYYFE